MASEAGVSDKAAEADYRDGNRGVKAIDVGGAQEGKPLPSRHKKAHHKSPKKRTVEVHSPVDQHQVEGMGQVRSHGRQDVPQAPSDNRPNPDPDAQSGDLLGVQPVGRRAGTDESGHHIVSDEQKYEVRVTQHIPHHLSEEVR